MIDDLYTAVIQLYSSAHILIAVTKMGQAVKTAATPLKKMQTWMICGPKSCVIHCVQRAYFNLIHF